MDTIKWNALYNAVRKNHWLNSCVILTRYLVGFAFIPSGLKKIMGQRFTQISIDNPVGFFFEAMFRSGYYWNFIGWAQFIAAFLLMTQRFSTIGAVVFFFIVSNIFVITISLSFSGTWIITLLMLLAVTGLLAWDYHKLRYLFCRDNFQPVAQNHFYPTYNNGTIIAGFILFGWCSGGLILLEKTTTAFRSTCTLIWLAGVIMIIAITIYQNRRRIIPVGASLQNSNGDYSSP